MARQAGAAATTQTADEFIGDDPEVTGEGADPSEGTGDDDAAVDDSTDPGEATVVPPPTRVPTTRTPAPAPGDEAETRGQHVSWKDYRETQRQLREAQENMQRQQAEFARQQQEYQAAQARIQQAVNPNAQHDQPGVTRPYTQAELVQLRDNDILEYNRVIGEMALQQQYQQSQQLAAMQETSVIRQHIEDFTRGDPSRQMPPRPDYMPAMLFLEERVGTILKATGIPDNEIQPRMMALSKALIIDPALRNGQSVAAAAYQIAQTLGWTGEEAAPVASTTRPGPKAAQTPQEKVRASKARTQAAAGSVGTIPGGPKGGRKYPTLAEFNAADEATLAIWDKEMPGWDENLEP